MPHVVGLEVGGVGIAICRSYPNLEKTLCECTRQGLWRRRASSLREQQAFALYRIATYVVTMQSVLRLPVHDDSLKHQEAVQDLIKPAFQRCFCAINFFLDLAMGITKVAM